jgi:excisionase family DNA binding protein
MVKETYTTEEAADFLGITPARVRQMIIDGVLETARFGRAHVISAAALEKARNRNTKPGPLPKSPQKNDAKKKGGKK